MKAPLRKFLIREGDGVREADTLVLGAGMLVGETAGGLPELLGVAGGEIVLQPSGGDDTQAIRDALATGRDVRLGPGEFNVGTITLGTGSGSTARGQRLIGSGVNRTRVRIPGSSDDGIIVQASGCGIEGLLLDGIEYVFNKTGIHAVSDSQSPPIGNLTVRGVRIERMGIGIHLENVSGCDIENVVIFRSNLTAIYAKDVSTTVLRNILVSTADQGGIHIEDGAGVVCESVLLQQVEPYGIKVSGGSGYRLSAVRVDGGSQGVVVENAAAVAIDSLVLNEALIAVVLSQARDVTLNCCRATYALVTLSISGSENVVVSALRSEFAQAVHLSVTSSAGVFVTGVRVVNSATPPATEVNVSGAGGRVLFGPHNFDPARINSGGNFVAL